jgi:hypothetical protein
MTAHWGARSADAAPGTAGALSVFDQGKAGAEMFRSRREDPTPLSNMVEATVRRHDGELIGVVDELLIDLQTGRVEYLLATDVHGQRLSLRWDAIDVRGGTFVLDGPARRN